YLRQHRRRLFLSQGEPFSGRDLFSLFLHCIEQADHFDRLARDLGGDLFGIDESPAQMCPASGTCDRVAGHHAVVSSIGICKENLVVIPEEVLWSIPAAVQSEIEEGIRM